MANMFSGHTNKEIPKNMDDCIKPDSVSTNLWVWCERLEKWGKILFWILLIGGLILSISSSIVEKEVIIREATYWSDAETEVRTTFDFELFIPLLLDTALYAFLEYCAYHIIALLVGALASIVQNTKISANVALYNTTYNSIDEVTHNTAGENRVKSNVKNEQQMEEPMTGSVIKKEINLSDESRYICEQIDILDKNSSGLCVMCRKNKDILKQCKIKNNIGTREIAICEDCIQLFNKNSSKN